MLAPDFLIKKSSSSSLMPLVILLSLMMSDVIIITTEANIRGPLLDYNYGEVHFRKYGPIGLKASLGNPFALTNATLTTTKSGAGGNNNEAVRCVAIIWRPNAPIYVSLDVYVTVFNSKTKRYSTSKVSLRVENDEIIYAVERRLLQAFNVECEATSPYDNLFVHKYRLPQTTKAVIFGLHNWTSFPKNRLFYPPAMITYYGRSFTSFPLAEGVASLCRHVVTGDGDDTAPARYQSVEISGEFELSSNTGHQVKVFAHADHVVDVSSYYARTRQETRCSDYAHRCTPVYIDDATVAPTAISGDFGSNFSEFACRPNAQQQVLEWWRCSDMGRQVKPSPDLSSSVIATTSGVPKFNVTVALGDYLVYCSDARFRDARALRWRWYNETVYRYEDFPLKGWRGSDTSCLWFTASLESSITRRAYQCLESASGKPVKEVYFEYNNGVVFTESCRFLTNGAISPSTSGNSNYNTNNNHKAAQKPSTLIITPGTPGRARITCHVRRRLNLRDGDDVNSTSTYSVVRWDKTEATSQAPEFLLQSNYVDDTGQFHLHINVDLTSKASLKRYVGIYTLVLHFEHDISQLVMQFRIREGAPSSTSQQTDDGADAADGTSAASDLTIIHRKNRIRTFLLLLLPMTSISIIITKSLTCRVDYL